MAGNDSERWAAIIAEVRKAPSPEESPALPRLYTLAFETGMQALGRFSAIDKAEREDIVQSKFTTELRAIVGAHNPRGLFVTALLRAGIDARRRHQTARRHVAEEVRQAGTHSGNPEEHRLDTLAMAACLASFTPRDQQILRAVFEGEERERVAQHFKTSRANVDQVISRARKRWKEWQ